MWGDDFVWTERLSWVYKGAEYLLLRGQREHQGEYEIGPKLAFPAFLHSPPTEVGKGLLIPKGIVVGIRQSSCS